MVAIVSFHVMERRLENPLNPPLAKRFRMLLILIDLTAPRLCVWLRRRLDNAGPPALVHYWRAT